ncbi:methyltransferase domain-containing protein [Phthorimaea operculella]|nr:methyltransferase domain-containing protein [Phthorimaea operculella]
MFRPELYERNNFIQAKGAFQCLKKNAPDWREQCVVLDLGCGDGSVTAGVLRPCLPPDFRLIVGVDIAPEMVAHANATNGDQRCKFIQLDMTDDMPEELFASFDHVFSSYVIHWIQNQEKLFSNILTVLKKSGNCLLHFIAYSTVFEVYREPGKAVYSIMANIGFKNISVECEIEYHHLEEEVFKTAMLAVFPVKLPEELVQDAMADFVQAARELKVVDVVDGETIINLHINMVTAKGTKS